MNRPISFPGLSGEVAVALLGIGLSFLVPEIRQFVGLEKVVAIPQEAAAPPLPFTRRLDREIRLEANIPREVSPDFFITYHPKPDPSSGGMLWVSPGDWGELLFDADVGQSRLTVEPGTVVRHHGNYQDTLFVMIAVTPKSALIR